MGWSLRFLETAHGRLPTSLRRLSLPQAEVFPLVFRDLCTNLKIESFSLHLIVRDGALVLQCVPPMVGADGGAIGDDNIVLESRLISAAGLEAIDGF